MSTSSEVLCIQDLSVIVKNKGVKKTIIDNVSLNINTNEIVALVGESGCGKTTLLKAILRLLSSETVISGKILYDDKNLLDLSEKELRNYRGGGISMIFQDPSKCLDPTMCVGKQIQEVLEMHTSFTRTQQKKIVLQSLTNVGFLSPDEIFRRYPHQLSGGQCQRIMIAMAIVTEPYLLLADEPTSALDVMSQSQIIQTLVSLRQQKSFSMIFVTHDLRLASSIADRIVVMYHGKIIEQNTTEEICRNPSQEYTKQLISCLPHLI